MRRRRVFFLVITTPGLYNDIVTALNLMTPLLEKYYT